LFEAFEPVSSEESKPDYDGFIQAITEEFAEDSGFKDRMRRLGEEINDLKEFIMLKIQDEISIYNSKS